MNMEGKTASVTGAGGGIGRAIALALAKNSVDGLVVLDQNAELIEQTAKEIREYDVAVETIAADITEPGVPEQLVSTAVRAWGRLDCAVNNAGVQGPTASIVECSDADWNNVLAVNLTSVFRCLRAQLDHMCQRRFGSIVNIGSASTFGVWPSMAAYVSSKSGVNGLSKVASKEAAPFGVRVNVVAPGVTTTPLMETWRAEQDRSLDELVGRIPLGRLATAAEIAAAVVWLLSDEASFTTGAVLLADGGRTG